MLGPVALLGLSERRTLKAALAARRERLALAVHRADLLVSSAERVAQVARSALAE